jgi:hypothetical protein
VIFDDPAVNDAVFVQTLREFWVDPRGDEIFYAVWLRFL